MIALITVAVIAVQGTGCGETKYPRDLPAPSTIVDSAHAMEDLAMFAGTKPMIFSLVFAKGDSVPQVRSIEKSDAAAAVALINYLRHQPAGRMWAIRVVIAGGDTPSVTLARSEYCPPEAPKSTPVAAAGASISRPGQAGTPLMSSGATAEALIGVDGRVIKAEVIGTTGIPQADYSFLQEIKRQQFKPARLDGEPVVAMWRSDGQSPRP